MSDINKETTLDDILNTGDAWVDGLPVILVDSDTICYRAAAATDGRQYLVGKVVFKYKGDAVAYCKKNDIPIEEIELEYYPEPLAHALKIVKEAINGIKQFANSKYHDYNLEFFHTSDKNFRKDILDIYKENRKDTRKPYHLDSCKGYVRRRFRTVEVEGLEADDLIGIAAYELQSHHMDYIIVTNDKDLKTIPGKHYNWVTEELTESSPVEAMKFFYAQCIAGDTTDNIPGVKGLGINDKGTGKAQKIIQLAHELWEEDYKDKIGLEEYLFETALEAWLEGGPGKNGSFGCQSLEEVIEQFEKSAKCLFILHKENELWKLPLCDWRNYGIL